MNNMYGKLNYQNVTTAAYSFALIVFALFGALTGALAAGISVLSACYLAALVAVEHFSARENKAISQ